jgi:Cyanobacterial TRADD-N associated 2-Transmembrane domain
MMMGQRDRGSQHTDQLEDDDEVIRHKTNAIRAGLLMSIIMLIIAAGACTGGVLLVRRHTDSFLAPAAFIAAAFFFVSAAAVPLVMFREGCIEEDEDRKCKKDCNVLEHALDRIPNRTLSGLAKANFRQMRMFTVIALRQARMSYYASLVAASVSLLVLASGGAVTVGLAGTSSKIAAGTVTAVGVAMSGFLSATFLKTYWMAARQMSYYYGQPLVHCYLLHAEWLTLMLTEHPEWKVDADLWQRVVTAAIQAGKNAQSHLLSMQEHSSNGRTSWRRRADVSDAMEHQAQAQPSMNDGLGSAN